MNPINEKIRKTSRFVAIITKILYITVIIALCVESVGIIWYVISPESSSFTWGGIKIVSPYFFSGSSEIATEFFTGICGQSFFVAILIVTNRIFKDISREYTPFLPQNIRRMKKIALLLLLDSIISPPIDLAIRASISASTSSLSGFSTEMTILAIVIYCFALIFQYGVVLQQQSDETL